MKKFNHLHVPDHWEQYWSKYPQGYTILEALINWVSQVDDMVDNVNDWNDYLNDFVNNFDKRLEPVVRAMLREMVEDGTLAEIIAEEVFTELNERTLQALSRTDNIEINIMAYPYNATPGEDISDILAQVFEVANDNDVILIPNYVFPIAKQIDIPKQLHFRGLGNAEIKPTSNIDSIIRTEHPLKIDNLTLNGANLSKHGLHMIGEMCTVNELIVKNTSDYAVFAQTFYDSVGNPIYPLQHEMVARNTTIKNCRSGFYMNGIRERTEVTLLNCKVTEVTDHTYFIDDHRKVLVQGGEFSGDSAVQNVYQCDNIIITDGYYHNIDRGVTIGQDTKNFVIDGNNIVDCGNMGLSIDTKLNDGTGRVPEARGIVTNNTVTNARYSYRIQGGNILIDGNKSEEPREAQGHFFVIESENVTMGVNHCIGEGRLLTSVRSTVNMLGDFYLNKNTSTNNIITNDGTVNYGTAMSYTAGDHILPYHINTVLADCTDGVIRLELPDPTNFRGSGKEMTIIRTDTTNNQLILTRTSGNVTINGKESNYIVNSGGIAVRVVKGSSTNYYTIDNLNLLATGTERPPNAQPGQQFFDQTLGFPIYYNGTSWVDSTGVEV